jgi:tungstate transport system substrate-binding protein
MHTPARAIVIVLATLATLACAGDAAPRDTVVLAATHTLEDSGLLDSLAAAYRRNHPEHELRVIVSGTGEALEQARRGDVDVVLSHAPAAEQRAIERGAVADRAELMYNHFLIAGPAADPAGVRRRQSASAALAAIAHARAPFVSRDDSSGTHLRELELWEAAGARPPLHESYIRVGGGMADALRIADQRTAYVLTDQATFAVLRPSLALVPVFSGEQDPALRNTYAVMTARRARSPAAATLHAWLQGDSARAIVARFGGGLFIPIQ